MTEAPVAYSASSETDFPADQIAPISRLVNPDGAVSEQAQPATTADDSSRGSAGFPAANPTGFSPG